MLHYLAHWIARFASLFVLLSVNVRADKTQIPAVQAVDTVVIVGISPTNFEDGRETEIQVTVAYDLGSLDEAVINLTANDKSPHGFGYVAGTKVKRGSGTVMVSGKFTPRHWGATIPARISVFLSGGTDPLVPKRPVASDETRIDVIPRDNPESAAVNPNPSTTYEDALRILNVSPETLTAGQETEVRVTVAYELLSREQGEINLGHSGGRSNGYIIAGKIKVAIGKGQAVVQARITPAKTGKLPFTKVFVNLSEFPHREKWVPLADDSHTLEVR